MAEVLFLQNIKGIAQVGDIKQVSNGYARNFLLPKKMAKYVTPATEKEAGSLRRKREIILRQESNNYKIISKKLEAFTLNMERLTSDEGTLYEGVGTVDISVALKKEGFEIEPEYIKLEHSLKMLGDHEVTIELNKETSVNLKVKITKREK